MGCAGSKTKTPSSAKEHASDEPRTQAALEDKKSNRALRQQDLAAAKAAAASLRAQGKLDELAKTMELVEMLQKSEDKYLARDAAHKASMVKNSRPFTVRVMMDSGEGFNEEVHLDENVGDVMQRIAPKIEMIPSLATQARLELHGKYSQRTVLDNNTSWRKSGVRPVDGVSVTVSAFAEELINADKRARTLNLYKATAEGDIEAVELVCKYAPERILETSGQSAGQRNEMPIHWAAKKGYSDVVTAMLDAQADPNVVDKYGQAPLHMAASKGHVESVKALLTANANVDIVDKDGDSPMQWAELNKHHKTYDVLFSALHRSKKKGMQFKNRIRTEQLDFVRGGKSVAC